jgi:hypothetical protein
VAWDNSSVVAWGNSSVEAWGNSSVEAWGNSSVVAWDNSSVVAWDNSSVEARVNSSVVARDNSSVEAWGNSSVVAWDNSSVVARDNVGIHLLSDHATVILFTFSVCWKLAQGKIEQKSKTSKIIEPKYKKGTIGWLEKEGIKNDKKVILYKKVSNDFKTQEGTENETLWAIGTTIEHPNWCPEKEECGGGKFHACSRTYFCDEFRDKKDDRYIAISIDFKDLYSWDNPTYPHKIAFRKGTVMGEVDKNGKIICE